MSNLWTNVATHSVPTSTKSIGTDLSMMDIGCLEDLQNEITELRKEVASLEAKLRKGKGELEANLAETHHQSTRGRKRPEEWRAELFPSLSAVCKKEVSLTASGRCSGEVVDEHRAQRWRGDSRPPHVFKHEPMDICNSECDGRDKKSVQGTEVPALFIQCYPDPSSTEAQSRPCASEDKGKNVDALPLSLRCYSDLNPTERLDPDHSGGDQNALQDMKDVHSLSPVFKTEPNPTETLEPDCSTGDQHTLPGDVPCLSLYCYSDLHQAHAHKHKTDYSGEHTLQEMEEDVPSLSLHCYSDPNPTESLGSDCNPGNQHTLQTPLKMCSVRLVDCRRAEKPNANTPHEEQDDYFEKDFKYSNVLSQSFSSEIPSALEHNIQKEGAFRTPSLRSHHITANHLSGDGVGESHSCIWRREDFITSSVPSIHFIEHNGEELNYSSLTAKHFPASAQLVCHDRDRFYPCNLCGKSFTDLSHRKSHERMHSGEGPYQCAQCGESFSFFYRFQNHQKAHAEEADVRRKPFHCSHCKKQFATKGSLVVHYRVHTGERPYPCSFCDQAFTRSDRLKDHERVHTGEKPYHCSSCGKQFSQAASLRTHRRIHTGEKPYGCSCCDRRFSDLTGLRTHERRHTGERPYHCSQCGKSFTQASNLVTHLRKHRAENTTSLKTPENTTSLKTPENTTSLQSAL